MTRRLLAIIFMFAILISFTSCGGDSSGDLSFFYDENEHDEVDHGKNYFEVPININGAGTVKDYVVEEGNIYILLKIDSDYTIKTYCIDNAEEKNIDVECEDDINKIIVTDNDIVLFSKNEINKIDKTGQVTKTGNIKDIVSKDEVVIEPYIKNYKDGYVVFTDKKIYIVDYDFSVKDQKEYVEGGTFKDASITNKGDLIVAFEDNGARQSIRICKYENNEFTELYSADISVDNCLLDGNEECFYLKMEDGIYSYSEDKKGVEKLIDYSTLGLTKEDVTNIQSLSDKKFINLYGKDISGFTEIYPDEKNTPNIINENKTKILIGSFSPSVELYGVVNKFNKSNRDYYVEIKDYRRFSDPYTQINLDIASDNCPDIFDLSYGHFLNDYINKGLLADLSEYYYSDSEINPDDLIGSVKDTIEKDGKIYYVASHYSIITAYTCSKKLKSYDQWDFDQFIECVKDIKPERLTGLDSSMDLLMEIGVYSLSDFTDKERCMSFITSTQFSDFIDMCKSYGQKNEKLYANLNDEKEMYDQLLDDVDDFRKGKILLQTTEELDIDMFQANEKIYEDVNYIGYPDIDGGSYFSFSNMYGISAASKNKEVAWQIIREFMTEDFQYEHMEYNMPTRQDCFDMKMMELKTETSYEDKYGNTIEPRNYEYNAFGVEVELKPITDEEEKEYIELVDSINKIKDSDTELLNIIIDESESYFNGDADINQTMNNIENRASVYLDETY